MSAAEIIQQTKRLSPDEQREIVSFLHTWAEEHFPGQAAVSPEFGRRAARR